MARVLGIDLGSSTVRVAVYEGSFGRSRLVELHSRRVVAEAGAQPGLGERLEALRVLLQEEELQGFSAVCAAWPAERASLRVLDLPFSDPAKIGRTLPFEVENYVPFEVDAMVLEHRVLERREDGCRVLCCLAEREGLGALLEGTRALGLDPRYLALDADALGVWAEEGQGTQVVLDLGHSRSLACLVRDGQVCDLRALQLGGALLDRAAMAAFGLDAERAEALRRRISLDPEAPPAAGVGWDDEERTRPGEQVAPPPPLALAGDRALLAKDQEPGAAALRQALREPLEELVADLRATLIAFEDRHGVEVDELLLAGGLACTDGIAALLSRELGLPVRPVVLPSPAHEREDAVSFALACALGRRAAGETRRPLFDLRQGELAHHSALQVLRGLASYGLAAAAFFVLAVLAVAASRHVKVSGEIGEVEAQIAEAVAAVFPEANPEVLADPSMALAVMQEGTMATAQKVAALEGSLRGEPPSLTLLKEISEAMPAPEEAAIDVRELVLSETAVSIHADTDGYEQAAKIEASLQAFPRFKDATKGDEKKRGEKVQFTLSIPLVTEADPAAEEG